MNLFRCKIFRLDLFGRSQGLCEVESTKSRKQCFQSSTLLFLSVSFILIQYYILYKSSFEEKDAAVCEKKF